MLSLPETSGIESHCWWDSRHLDVLATSSNIWRHSNGKKHVLSHEKRQPCHCRIAAELLQNCNCQKTNTALCPNRSWLRAVCYPQLSSAWRATWQVAVKIGRQLEGLGKSQTARLLRVSHVRAVTTDPGTISLRQRVGMCRPIWDSDEQSVVISVSSLDFWMF